MFGYYYSYTISTIQSFTTVHTLGFGVLVAAVHVHVHVFAAQTGVTRFLQENARWVYNKSEAVELGRTPSEYLRYTHVLREWRAGPEHARDEAFR